MATPVLCENVANTSVDNAALLEIGLDFELGFQSLRREDLSDKADLQVYSDSFLPDASCWQEPNSPRSSECSSVDSASWTEEPEQFLDYRSPLECWSEYSPCEGILSTSVWSKQICRKCQRRFENSYSLEQHAKQSGHANFVCPVTGCGRCYTRRDSLARHRKSHDQELVCAICRGRNQKKTFKRKDHLRSHIRNCHPEYPESVGVSAASRCGEEIRPYRCFCACERDSGAIGQSFGIPMTRQDSAVSLVGPLLDSPSSSRQSNVGYESRAMYEIVEALQTLHPGGSDAVKALDDRLKLNRSSTTQQLAQKLVTLASECPTTPAGPERSR